MFKKLTIDEILEKAFTTADLASGGLLLPDQAAKFIQGVIDKSIILNECRRVPMKADKRQIDKISYTSDILQIPNAVGVIPSATSKPVTTKVTLSAEEVIVAIDLGYDAIEDSIEGGGIFNTIWILQVKKLRLKQINLSLMGILLVQLVLI